MWYWGVKWGIFTSVGSQLRLFCSWTEEPFYCSGDCLARILGGHFILLHVYHKILPLGLLKSKRKNDDDYYIALRHKWCQQTIPINTRRENSKHVKCHHHITMPTWVRRWTMVMLMCVRVSPLWLKKDFIGQ